MRPARKLIILLQITLHAIITFSTVRICCSVILHQRIVTWLTCSCTNMRRKTQIARQSMTLTHPLR